MKAVRKKIPQYHPTLTGIDTPAEFAASVLDGYPDYKVITRLKPQATYRIPDGRPLAKGVIVDVETTGLSYETDVIIELGMVVFEFDPKTGDVFRVLDTFNALEDPGFPIPAEAVATHGITDTMVAGQKINDAEVEHFVADAALVVAHNAGFDRAMLEKRFSVFATLPWGCSLRQIDWKGEGVAAASLEYLAYTNGFFYDAHRAVTDCQALLAILAKPLPTSGVPALKVLLDQASQDSYRVYATGAAFEAKETLKARAYRWDPDQKCWYKTVTGAGALNAETAWLKTDVYQGRPGTVNVETFDSKARFSLRPGRLTSMQV